MFELPKAITEDEFKLYKWFCKVWHLNKNKPSSLKLFLEMVKK